MREQKILNCIGIRIVITRISIMEKILGLKIVDKIDRNCGIFVLSL